MKIWVISDTHTSHNKLSIPAGLDMVIHCGDESHNIDGRALHEFFNFFAWFKALPIKHKIMIPGNHSKYLWDLYKRNEPFPEEGTIILMDNLIEIEGLKIFGSPWTPSFSQTVQWPFTKKRGKMNYNIPNCDILVTHGPPKFIADLSFGIQDRRKIEQVGCKELYNEVYRIKPKVHAFGHVHDDKDFLNYGLHQRDEIKFYNAALTDYSKQVIHPGFILDI